MKLMSFSTFASLRGSCRARHPVARKLAIGGPAQPATRLLTQVENGLKFILVFLIALLSFLAPSVSGAYSKVVNLYNWSNYLPDDVIRQFEKETGIHVNYSTYDTNETLYAKLKADPNATYDIVVPSTYFIDRMRRQNMLRKIDKSKIPNFKNLSPAFLDKSYDPQNEYSIPYLWSITAIAINTRYLQHDSITRWADLWKPQYQGELLLLNDPREVFSVALMVLGYSPNDTQPEHIKQAYEKLKQLMPNVKLFNTEAEEAIYIDEDVTLGMGWSGDIYMANKENPHIKFIYPKEGYLISLENLAIPKGAQHMDNAYQLINFLLRPDIAKRISMSIGFGTPNFAAYRQMPLHFRKNAIIFGDGDILKHGQFLTDVGQANAIYEKYLEKLKIGEFSN